MSDNLKKGNPATQFTSGRKAVENGRKGGIACAKAKKEKKALKETLETLLEMPIKEGRLVDIDKIKIMLSMLNKAAKGDVRAAEYIRDTIGQKPANMMNVDMNLPVLFEGEDELE